MKLPPTHRRLQKPKVLTLRDTDLMKTPDGWEEVFPETVGDDVSDYTCPLARLRSKPLTSNADKKTVRILDPKHKAWIEEKAKEFGKSESFVIRMLIRLGLERIDSLVEAEVVKIREEDRVAALDRTTIQPDPKPLSFWERRREAKFQRSLLGVRP